MAVEGPKTPSRRARAALAVALAASLGGAAEAAPSYRNAQACEKIKSEIIILKQRRAEREKECPISKKNTAANSNEDPYWQCRGLVSSLSNHIATKKELARVKCGDDIASRL